MLKKYHLIPDIHKKNHLRFFATLLSIFNAELAKGESISIRGFGKFYTINQTERKVKHPSTGQLILSKQKKIAKFKSFKSLRKDINDFAFDLEEFKKQNKTILRQLFDIIESAEDYVED